MTLGPKRKALGTIFALAAMLAAVLSRPLPGQTDGSLKKTQHRKASAPKAAAPEPAKPVAMPFRAGETLNYRVSWSAFSNAASLQLAVPEQRDLFGYPTWHFRALAHTLNPVRSLFSVDDQFDSYTDQTTLEARQSEMHLDELGKIDDQVSRFVAPGETSHLPGPSVVVPAGTRDPLGTLYVLRHVDWEHTPELAGTVFDGRDLYEFSAKRQTADEKVAVASGAYSASRISIDISQREKPVPGVHLIVWIADDAARTPVLMQAQMPFGNLRAELTSASR